MNVHKLELCLAELVRRLRSEAETRAAALERRLTAVEVEAKFHRGEPVTEREWSAFVTRMQHRDPGTWEPRHASWRNGGGSC